MPSIVRVGLLDSCIGCAYALVIVAGLAFTDTGFGHAVSTWIGFTKSFVASALFFLPAIPEAAPPETVIIVLTYRHILVACGFMTALWINWNSLHSSAWSKACNRRHRASGIPSFDLGRHTIAAYRLSVLGTFATLFLVLFGGATSDMLNGFLCSNAWTMFRAQILLAACCYFVCYTQMLRPLLPRDEP